jgi:hypothetical protein
VSFILKIGMPMDTTSLQRSVPDVANYKGPEEELEAEYSLFEDWLPARNLSSQRRQ